MKTKLNREAWLINMATALRPMFKKAGAELPAKIRVTCGWPSHRALSTGKKRSIGECWSEKASADRTHEILISPVIAKGVEVAAILTHELVHAAVGTEAGHRAPFSQLAKSIGLEKPWTATTASKELSHRFNALIKKPYPHAKLDRNMCPTKKDGTRMLKVICPKCGYTIRTTAKWIAVGLPTCPCGTEMEAAE